MNLTATRTGSALVVRWQSEERAPTPPCKRPSVLRAHVVSSVDTSPVVRERIRLAKAVSRLRLPPHYKVVARLATIANPVRPPPRICSGGRWDSEAKPEYLISPLDIPPAREEKRTSTNTMHIRMTTPVVSRTLVDSHQRSGGFVSWQQVSAVHRSAFRQGRAACPASVRPLRVGCFAGVPKREATHRSRALHGVRCEYVRVFRKPLGHTRLGAGLIRKGDGLFELDHHRSESDAGLFRYAQGLVEIEAAEIRSGPR